MGILATLANLTRRADPAPRRRSLDAAAGGRRAVGMGVSQGVPAETASASIVRQRGRYAAMNNPWIGNAVGNMTAALVGSGLRPAPLHEERATRRNLTRAFDAWAADADWHGQSDFWGLQALIGRHLAVDGEALVLLRDTDEGLRLQVLPPEHLDESKSIVGSAEQVIVAGVEFDAQGRRVAYHILPERPATNWQQYAPAVRVDAADVLHIVHPIGAGQTRGLSWLAPIILTASELDQLTDALLVGAKTAAMFAGFIVNTADPSGVDDMDPAELSLEPGAIRILPGGADIRFTSPQQAAQGIEHAKLNLRAMAAGLGIPEHLLTGDLSGANYSSLRAGLLPFRARMEQVQYHTLVPQLLRPIWRRWLALEVAAGRQDAIVDADWIAPRPQQVDPLKDAAALEKHLAMGLTTKARAIAELGWNPDDLEGEESDD
ncbi:phage portal protein [Paracoccus yeei]|uniref:phage portal protein n=1 Tax=Paracoccus yeei TaxID=147645 RepID=UPI0017498DBE|nr:phage portal protein [Paracoccus yeei]